MPRILNPIQLAAMQQWADGASVWEIFGPIPLQMRL